VAIIEITISISVAGFITDRASLFGPAGAVITSRKVFGATGGWGDDGFYRMPVFVLTPPLCEHLGGPVPPVPVRVTESRSATHLTYRVANAATL
jgi:hypothetical protein